MLPLLLPIARFFCGSNGCGAFQPGIGYLRLIDARRGSNAGTPEKIKKKFRKQLYDTKPITPKHQPPKTIGGEFASLVREQHRAFFADFADFANVVNWWLADEHVGSRWRLQELPETELRLHGVFDYGPTFGRSYAVFYNQARLRYLRGSI